MKTPSGDLSKRETEVVEHLLQGKSNKQIAHALGITESTVEFHLKNIYGKLQVRSRTEAILKLGRSVGRITKDLGKTIVDNETKIEQTGGTFIFWRQWTLLLQQTVSKIQKEIEMKNRLVSYVVSGLLFGGLFLLYFEGIDRWMNTIPINAENPFQVWAFISLEFLLVFGVWMIPTVYPARYEFRRSKKVALSAAAVIVMWVSAVLGYHLVYPVWLAVVGFPHPQPGLLVFKFVQWAVVAAIVGGLAGLVTSWFYSIWMKKNSPILPT